MRCEGYVRRGGVFTFGPVEWVRCSNDATVSLTVIQDGHKDEFPSCAQCWSECIARGFQIVAAEPLVPGPSQAEQKPVD